MVIELKINSVDRTSFLIEHDLDKTIEWYSGHADIDLIDDESNTLRNNLTKFQDIEVFDDTGLVRIFRGVIIDMENEENNNSLFKLFCQDYWYRFGRKHISKTYTNQTASFMVKDIMSTFFPEFTVVGVQATVTTYTYQLRSRNVALFLQELALLEGFVIYVDEIKDIIFKPEKATDSGVHWVFGNGDIYEEKFEEMGRDLVNAVFVEGRGGTPPDIEGAGANVIDYELVAAANGTILEMPKITDTTLTTADECRDRGETEIKKRNQSPNQGYVIGGLDYAIDVGKVITLTIPHRGYTAATFLVRSVKHLKAIDKTEVSVIYTSKFNEDLVGDILLQARQLQEIETDDSTLFPAYLSITEQVVVEVFAKVERRDNAGAYFGNKFFGNIYFGGQNTGIFEEILAEEKFKVTNQAFEKMWRVIGQIATIPNDLRNGNNHLAYGNDSQIINFDDLTINNEDGRLQADVGFPNVATDFEFIVEYSIDDTELMSGTIRNVGMLNAASVGDLFFAGVFSESFNKNLDEVIKITFRVTFDGIKGFLTNLGRNRFRDLVTNNSTDYLDNTNAHIEVITSPVYRDDMRDASYPRVNVVGDKMTLSTEITAAEISSNSLDGKTYTGIDVYEAASAGDQLVDGELGATVTINTGEPQVIDVNLLGVRST